MPVNAARPGISAPVLLWMIILAHAAVGSTYALTRLYTMKTLGFDLGAFNQLMSQIVATGRPVTTLSPTLAEGHWFGFHFSPILYALVPLYKLFPGPETLLVVQALCCSLAAWPVYLTLRALEASPRRALLWTLAYLFNPFTLNAMVWDFHEVCLAIPVFAFGLWAVAAKRWRALLPACLLLLLVKEHYGLAVAGFGALWGLRHGERRRAMLLMAAGLVAFALILGLVMPYFRGGGEHVMFTRQVTASTPRYQWMLDVGSWPAILPNLIVQNAQYVLYLLVPLCLLPAAGWIWLLPGIADFASISLFQGTFYRSVFSYHTAALVPMLVIAAYQGSAWVSAHWKIPLLRLDRYVLLLTVICGWLFAPLPLPLARNVWSVGAPRLQLTAADAQAVASIKRLLPEGTGVSAQCNVTSLFDRHYPFYVFPFAQEKADFTIIQLGYVPTGMGIPYCVRLSAWSGELSRLLADRRWGIAYWQDPWLVLQRNAGDLPGARKAVMRAYGRLMKIAVHDPVNRSN